MLVIGLTGGIGMGKSAAAEHFAKRGIPVFNADACVHRLYEGEAVAAILYQGVVVAGICFIVWAELLKRHAAGTLSMFAFLVPITGIALSAWFFGEPLRATLIVGGALVLAGVWAVTRE